MLIIFRGQYIGIGQFQPFSFLRLFSFRGGREKVETMRAFAYMRSALAATKKSMEGNPQKFEWGTGELIFYFDEDENYDYDILSTIAMTVKDEGTTNPGGGEQKPDGGEQKPDGGDQKPNGDGNNNGDSQKPSVKPQTKPEVKPQKDDTTTTPKTGDPSAVAGLLGTSIGSLGVALMALKRRFRK